VAFDFEAGGVGEVAHEVGHSALVEVLDCAAVRADQVVVMPALGEAVVEAAVLEEDAADDAKLSEKANRSEDGGAAGAAAAVKEIVDGEAVTLGEDRGDHCPPGGGYAMAARFELKCNRFEVRH
jgi:hypothetical protein